MTTKRSPALLRRVRYASTRLNAALVTLLSLGTASGLQAQSPSGGVVRAGDVQIHSEGVTTRIEQFTDRAIIDWRDFNVGAAERVIFLQPSDLAATLNRVTGDQVSVILGRLDANGQILLINPNGILFGGGARINVGSLIASTSNVSDANFLAGRLVFDVPGRPGAGVFNAGALTAKEGGLVALVAPHVRNDGVIVARLGKAILGAADTFTVDLYGDGLINLALSEAHAGQLRHVNGEPIGSLIAQNGRIETAGGLTVLMTARNGRNVLDSLINMNGTIRAESATRQGGRILLLGEGGTVGVDGTLSVTGARGGRVQVLGDTVHLAGGTTIDASGTNGGGLVEVGGSWQGSGETHRAQQTTVDASATLLADATRSGAGGEVVVWSDGRTRFAGAVQARGGMQGGDGGRMEVSGKQRLEFLGEADASAARGANGSLLLDPASLDIGTTEASVITRVLRTGTSTSLQADQDINVNAAIYGGDRTEGGGLTMTAGHTINVNDFIVTNNGAINLNASSGTVNVLPGRALFAGNAAITITANGSITTAPMITGGALSIQSIVGSVAIDAAIDARTGPVSIRAADDVDINQAIVNLTSGSSALTVAAGGDVRVNAQVDGRGPSEGGAVTMTAGRDLQVNQAIVTSNGAIALSAANGALTVAEDAPLVSGTGALSLAARDDITAGASSSGTLAIVSTAGSVAVNGLIDASTGDTRISAAADVNINQAILNGRSGGALDVAAGRDMNVNAVVDGRGGAPGGPVTMTAGRNLAVNDWIATNGGAIDLRATGGTATVARGSGLVSGSGAITMRSAGDLTTGAVSGGSFDASSTAGSLRVNGVVDGSTGRVNLRAAGDVVLSQPVLNGRTGSDLIVGAGRDVIVNAQVDGRGGAPGGEVRLAAGRTVHLGATVVTNDASITATAAGGAIETGSGTALVAGSGSIALDAAGNIRTRAVSGGSFRATSNGGTVSLDGIIDSGTGPVDVAAARDVNINDTVLSPRSGAAFSASAGQDVNVNARIDGTAGAAGGAVSLRANGDVNVNAPIATRDGAISLTAVNGSTHLAPAVGLFAGTGAVTLDSYGSIATNAIAGGATTLTSRAGSVSVGGPIAGAGGAVTIAAAGQVDVASSITNPGSTSTLTIQAGTDITVDAHLGRTGAGVPSGAVVLAAAGHITLGDSVITEDGDITVTARDGAVTVASGEGLFAGTGDVRVTSGQTLAAPLVATTGTVAFTSTAGAVDILHAIDGGTGAVTIAAATDVNIQQRIDNPRSGANLAVTASRDITLSAAINGVDAGAPAPSGSVTLSAGNNLSLGDDIVTNDAPIALSATAGSLTWTPGAGLYAGSGAIFVSSGGALTTGVTQTTGALNLTSTGSDVTTASAIDDATGAVTITAAGAVIVTETITNLKSGADLAITAGGDIDVLANVDGRAGAAPGGTVTMTAGNDLNVGAFIATSDGAVSLTATSGAVILPVGVESAGTPMQWSVSAGSGPVHITSGADFTLTSPVATTGALTIASTGGDVTIDAPITYDTGAVTITAADALTIDHHVRSNDQAITLNAGAGGITIETIAGEDFESSIFARVSSGSADLTLNSVGDVAVHDWAGLGTTGTLTIDSRGMLVTGSVGLTALDPPNRPQAIVLNADGGIQSFTATTGGTVTASSSSGSIAIAVESPSQLRIATGTPGTLDCASCDIVTGGLLGPDAVLNAGGSVLVETVRAGDMVFIARSGDVNMTALSPYTQADPEAAVMVTSLTVQAGRDVLANSMLWTGPLTITAGRDIVLPSGAPIRADAATLTAGHDVTMHQLQTGGAVSITAQQGDITLNNDIGPTILADASLIGFDPLAGVASLILTAPASTATITMQGARASGDVTISTGGDLTAAKEITSLNGTVTLNIGGTTTLNQAVPIGSQLPLIPPGMVGPPVSGGPRAPLPSAPFGTSVAPAAAPVLGEIAVAAADQSLGPVVFPSAASGSVGAAGVGGSAAAPATLAGSTGRPAAPTPGAPAGATGASDLAGLDSAAAVRVAGQSCSTDGEQGDGGLQAIAPAAGASSESDPEKASCGPVQSAAGPTGAPAAPAPGTVPPAPPVTSQGGLQ